MIKTHIPIVIYIRCVQTNKSFSIYKFDSSASLDDISAEICRTLTKEYGYLYRQYNYDVFTNFDFTHNQYFNPKLL